MNELTRRAKSFLKI